MEFAALNDLGLEFFLREIIVHLQRDQKVIGQCAAELARAPAARSLAEEAYGNLQGHIELLEGAAEVVGPFCRKGPTCCGPGKPLQALRLNVAERFLPAAIGCVFVQFVRCWDKLLAICSRRAWSGLPGPQHIGPFRQKGPTSLSRQAFQQFDVSAEIAEGLFGQRRGTQGPAANSATHRPITSGRAEMDDDLAEKELQAEVVQQGEFRRIRPRIRLSAALDDGLGHALEYMRLSAASRPMAVQTGSWAARLQGLISSAYEASERQSVCSSRFNTLYHGRGF